jgi:two-component system response regulator AtoC
MNPLRILIADDEPELREAIKGQLNSRGFQIDEASDGTAAWAKIQSSVYDLVLLDVRMPAMSGLEVLKRIKEVDSSTTVVMITAHASIQDAVQAVHNGAFDYIEKPLKTERLNELVDQALQARTLVRQVALSNPREQGDSEASSSVDFVGESKPMKKIFELIDRLAKVNTSVLIRGENGTGKELVARAIHYNSQRKHRPFVAVNCGAIPEGLVESEFFGHEKGAFTGADARKIGRFQFASGGTLFLDEVAELPLAMQVKLLRVLQERKITPVGSNREFNVDVRIIAATNRSLEKMISEGGFRNDLFYRLNVMPVFLPPLRERTEDLPQLVSHFVTAFNRKHSRNLKGVAPEALEQLRSYRWPGNIRELENAVEHGFVLETGEEIRLESFPEHILESLRDKEEGWEMPMPEGFYRSSPEENAPLDFQKAKEHFEREFIISALKKNNGRINQTCETANIPKNTLLRKIRKYSILAKDYE